MISECSRGLPNGGVTLHTQQRKSYFYHQRLHHPCQDVAKARERNGAKEETMQHSHMAEKDKSQRACVSLAVKRVAVCGDNVTRFIHSRRIIRLAKQRADRLCKKQCTVSLRLQRQTEWLLGLAFAHHVDAT
jgi:hypothetical protein